MIHAMIDIETLSTKTNAVILSIGAVKFNYDDHTVVPFDPLYIKPDVDEQTAMGRNIMESTIEFWSKQDASVQADTFSDADRVPLSQVTAELNKWLVGSKLIWGQGYGFDMNILETLYNDIGLPLPWNFWQIRDSRSVLGLFGIKPAKQNTGALHNALADAYHQATCLQDAIRQLNEMKTLWNDQK